MAKYLDKTQEEWDDLVELWHSDASIDCSLQEFLELDDVEYLKFAHGMDAEVSDSDVYKISNKICADVVMELAIKPKVTALNTFVHLINP